MLFWNFKFFINVKRLYLLFISQIQVLSELKFGGLAGMRANRMYEHTDARMLAAKAEDIFMWEGVMAFERFHWKFLLYQLSSIIKSR